MATASFDRRFSVTDSRAVSKLRGDLDAPRVITVKERDFDRDAQKGLQLLKQRLSALKS
jgi:hypothetical protein